MFRFFGDMKDSIQNRIQLSQMTDIANKACHYARSQILKGSSQIENNELDSERLGYLIEGIGSADTGIRGAILDQAEKLNDKLKDESLALFISTINISSKYSLGNCDELAKQALAFVLLNQQTVNAELFNLNPGDHVILVLNRDKDSTPQLPSTWGPACVICDPWANKVFPSAEYKEKLTGFHHDQKKAHSIPYEDTSGKQLLLAGPVTNMNSSYLRDKYLTVMKEEQNKMGFKKV